MGEWSRVRRRKNVRLRGLASAVALAGAVAVGLVACTPFVSPSDSASLAPSEGPGTNEGETGACDAPAGDYSTSPDDLRWEVLDGVSWPVSDSLGPTATSGDWAVCFSRSPTGAALAATSISFSAADHSVSDVTEFYVVDSPGKSAALEKARTETPRDFVGGLRSMGMAPVGFIMEEYSEDRASGRLVFSLPQGNTGYIGVPFTVVWVDGDWRLKVLDDGSAGEGTEVTAGEFEPWVHNGD